MSASLAVDRRHLEGIVRELEQLLETATHEDLPEVLGVLERTRARAFERLIRPPAADEEDPLLTMQEVAERLSVKVSRVRELGRRGELPTVMVGRYVRVRLSSLEEWIKRSEIGVRSRGRR